MLYLAIPAQNEVATIGVLLWRLRTVLAEFPREYEVVVYDDASTDETADVAQQYASAMPVTVIRGNAPIGYAGAVDALVRYVSAATRYPRRDALLLLQGDFTDPPGIVPEFARRFEGGADIVVGERTAVVDAPTPVRRLFSVAGWALRPFVRVDGVKDLTSSMRLVRVSVLRDLLRGDDGTVCEGDTWTANADLLLRLVPHARRIESVPMEPTYGVRMRDTRRATVRDALASLRWGWRARGRRVLPAATVDVGSDRSRDRIETGREPARDTSRESSRDRGRDDAREASLGPLDRGRGQNHDRSKDPRRGADKRGREGASAAVGPGEAVEPREAIGAEAGPAHGKRTPSAESLEAAAARAAEHETARAARRDAARDAGRGGNQDRVKESARGNKKRTPPAEAAGAVTGKRPPAATDDTLLHDPFAAPRRSEDTALNAVRGRTTHVKSPNDNDSSPYREDDSDTEDQEVVADTSSEISAADADPLSDTDVPARKRRRNRRSRRRKTGGDQADSNEDGELLADDVNAEARDDRSSPYGLQELPRSHGGIDVGHVADDSQVEETGAEGVVDPDGVAAPKRRGRRGRRGGARRSRGRGKRVDAGAGGDDTGDDTGHDSPDASGQDGARDRGGSSASEPRREDTESESSS